MSPIISLCDSCLMQLIRNYAFMNFIFMSFSEFQKILIFYCLLFSVCYLLLCWIYSSDRQVPVFF